MAEYFDESEWDKHIVKLNWYMGWVWDEIKRLTTQPESEELKKKIRVEIRNYFADRLDRGAVALGEGKDNLDSERKKIDTIIIHHTSSDESYSLEYLNAVHLLNIYVPYFRNPILDSEKSFKGTPLQSGHFYLGSQVFWGYHWFIDFNGRVQHILHDKAVGWHAGNWDTNLRSIGICLDGDFINKQPNQAQMEALDKVISTNYRYVDNDRIIGHKDANPETQCPGYTFEKWRPKLLKNLSN